MRALTLAGLMLLCTACAQRTLILATSTTVGFRLRAPEGESARLAIGYERSELLLTPAYRCENGAEGQTFTPTTYAKLGLLALGPTDFIANTQLSADQTARVEVAQLLATGKAAANAAGTTLDGGGRPITCKPVPLGSGWFWETWGTSS